MRKAAGEPKPKTTVDLMTEKKRFWAGLKMLVMQRQSGISWADAGKMMIDDFFHVLYLSEKHEQARQKAAQEKTGPARKASR